MTLKSILAAAEKYVLENSPGILTGLGVAGTVTTTVLVGRQAFRIGMDASTRYHETVLAGENAEGMLDNKYLIKAYWKDFIPGAISGITTVTCIIAANHIGSRRTAAIAAAFKISEQLAEEYKERVVTALGAKKEEAMRSELAKDRMERTGGSDLIIITGPESVFYDEMSGRFFKAEMENVRKAVNDINYKVNNYYHASLSDFYEMIGLSKTEFSDTVGWNTDQLLELSYAATLLPDGRAAIAISFNKHPIGGYDRLH